MSDERQTSGAVTGAELERWRTEPLADLMDHLIERFHRRHLAEIDAVARTVASWTEPGWSAMTGAIAIVLRQLAFLLDHHQRKEETRLFPLLRTGRFEAARGAIAVMGQEHRQLDALADRLGTLTAELAAVEAPVAPLEALHAELVLHTVLEDEVLFPRALAEPS